MYYYRAFGLFLETDIEFQNLKKAAEGISLKGKYGIIYSKKFYNVDPAKKYRMSLDVRVTGNRAVFSVRDDGRGIPQERLNNLFGTMVSDDSVPVDSRGAGMGIGLSVCASIIKAHGGEIWGGNRATGGAEMCFALEMEETDNEQQPIQDFGDRG